MKGRPILVGMLALGLLLAVAGSAGAGPSRQGAGDGEVQTVALAVPGLISYQGRLVDAAGNPVADGPYTMTFRLYELAAGGTASWIETKAVTVTGGLLTILLGDTTALDLRLFDGRDLWLSVQVGAEAEMTPRQRIASVPYAIYSYNADALDGAHASAFALSTHNHDARYVNVDGDVMRGNLALTPLLDVANSGTGFGMSGYGQSNIGVYGGSGRGSGLLGISGLIGVYGNGEDTGVAGAGRQIGVSGIGGAAGTGVRGSGMTGVWGESTAGSGVRGQGGAYGVYGSSTSGMGVFGVATEPASLAPAVYGRHEGAGPGVQGQSAGGEGVRGTGAITGVTGIGGLFKTGVYGEAPSGVGVKGKGDAGVIGDGQIGVQGTGLIGVDGQGTQKGVQGVGNDYNAVGVEGRAGFGTGVRGWGETGVFGESNLGPGVSGRGATGVSGHSTIGYGVSGTTDYAKAAGVYARGATDTSPDLILGGTSASNDNGNISSEPGSAGSDLYLYSNDEVGIHVDENDDQGSYFRLYNGTDQVIFRVDESGNTWALGTKGAAVSTKDQGMRTLYALESTGVWFEDFGVAQLREGVAVVKIDPLFAETVNLAAGYHVFLTPVDGWAALYVVNKTPTSFEVRDAHGAAGSAFDYRIVARRLGYENVRMEPVKLEAEEQRP